MPMPMPATDDGGLDLVLGRERVRRTELSAAQVHRFRDVRIPELADGSGERRWGRNRLRLHSMLSFEPFTIQPLGSPQVFQTGETFEDAPLIDYQHPHDLIMDLGADVGADHGPGPDLCGVVGRGRAGDGPAGLHAPPERGRESTAPLGHHQMDATHISHGVVTGASVRARSRSRAPGSAAPSPTRTARISNSAGSIRRLGASPGRAAAGRAGQCRPPDDAGMGGAVLERDAAHRIGRVHRP